MINQRYLPRISEGEIRFLCIGANPVSIVEKKPAKGKVSCVLGTGAVYNFFEPDDPNFAKLLQLFQESLPAIMKDLSMHDYPLIWTADFIKGPKDENGDDTFFVGEFNCSCVGITTQLHLCPLIAETVIKKLDFKSPQVT